MTKVAASIEKKLRNFLNLVQNDLRWNCNILCPEGSYVPLLRQIYPIVFQRTSTCIVPLSDLKVCSERPMLV